MKGSIRASNFRELRGTLFWGPYNKDPTFQGTILGSPIFGNSHMKAPTNTHKTPYSSPYRLIDPCRALRLSSGIGLIIAVMMITMTVLTIGISVLV